MTDYAAATLEEIWSNGRLVERRLSHGSARGDERGITAIDSFEPQLVERCERAMADAAERCRAPNARFVAESARDAMREETLVTIVLRERGLAAVTDPQHFAEDHRLLVSLAEVPESEEPVSRETLPIVWRNGSGAVLLHEAVGHPRESDAASMTLPSWLHVDVPVSMRRATFRDVPLRRMTRVDVRQAGAPFELPDPRLEVWLVEAGAWEPLTDRVTIQIAAALRVDGAVTTRVPRFSLEATREEVVRALVGAEGEPVRYPGVICSREGQELYVPSSAPALVTVFR